MANGAPECPKARICLVSLLVINRTAVYSTRLSILAWISNALVLWGSSKHCRYRAQVHGCCGKWLGPRLSTLQQAAAQLCWLVLAMSSALRLTSLRLEGGVGPAPFAAAARLGPKG